MIRKVMSALARSWVKFVHVRGARAVHEPLPPREGVWEDQPLHHIVEGAPVARAVEFGQSGDGGLSFGTWDCSAGRFQWYYFADEVITILEGEAFVVIDGKTEHLVAGSVIYFPFGTLADWHVPEYIRKQYILRHPARHLRRFI